MNKGKRFSQSELNQLQWMLKQDKYNFNVPNDEGGYDRVPKIVEISQELGRTSQTIMRHVYPDYRKQTNKANRKHTKKYHETDYGIAASRRCFKASAIRNYRNCSYGMKALGYMENIAAGNPELNMCHRRCFMSEKGKERSVKWDFICDSSLSIRDMNLNRLSASKRKYYDLFKHIFGESVIPEYDKIYGDKDTV